MIAQSIARTPASVNPVRWWIRSGAAIVAGAGAVVVAAVLSDMRRSGSLAEAGSAAGFGWPALATITLGCFSMLFLLAAALVFAFGRRRHAGDCVESRRDRDAAHARGPEISPGSSARTIVERDQGPTTR